MLSQIPINLEKINKQDIDKEIARAGMIAELDAVSMYEQLAAYAQDQSVKKVLLDIAREEKTHIGEFEALLLKKDNDQAQELENGKKEVAKLNLDS